MQCLETLHYEVHPFTKLIECLYIQFQVFIQTLENWSWDLTKFNIDINVLS